ncbi:hypothetical protein N7470_004784 [Penicillium chermesinum]|nr:hypothetical protein N7470_004784 [Penicillium chermesinum]
MAKSETELRSMMAKGKDLRELPWFDAEIDEVPEPAKTILERYSQIPADQILDHVKGVSPVYPEVLQRLKSGQKLLDVGCAIGQELRKLVYDGVPGENLYASDLRGEFFDIGYDLFKDRSTLKAKFISTDIFDNNSELIKTLLHQVDIVNAASFFHLFSWDSQVLIGKRLVSLLRAQPGSLIIGRQVGRIDPIDPDDKENAPEHYRHDDKTWLRLWEQIQRETGTQWEVFSRLEEWKGADKLMKSYHNGLQTFKLRFVIRRI